MNTEDKLIIGLVGETGSGKDTVANHINKKYDVTLRRFASPLKKTLRFFTKKASKDDNAWLYGVLKERFGEDVLHEALRKEINHLERDVICVNGLRMPKDEEFIRSFPNSVIIYVTADQHLRWERTLNRGEKSDDNKPFEDFQEFEATAETEKAVPEIGARAEHKIQNAGTLDDLLSATNDIMDQLLVDMK